MKIEYYGKKETVDQDNLSISVTETFLNGASINDRLKHIERHSPDGFQWGYSGSGPSDLALSILVDFCNRKNLDKDIPDKYYQKFKQDFISKYGDVLKITSEEIDSWLSKQIIKG